MNKLLTTLALAFALTFGGMAAASPATAAETTAECGVNDPACPTVPPNCTDPALSTDPICGRVRQLTTELAEADQTVTDYRQQVAALEAANEALQARVDRLQRKSDRQAATIQRLRDKIRSLR